MKHASIPLETPIELISMEPSEFSPLISKCQIKVCWVGDDGNRNDSLISKQVARDAAPSLRGAAIVGYYDAVKEDFEQHNKLIEVRDNRIVISENTRPYGFVDLNAKVWFQWFLDDDGVQREYMVTEGWLWTGQYPECQRVITKGNGQSMELDENLTQGAWSNLNNSGRKLFIINETVISKLCILGEDVEPCFEGANITNTQFSFNPNFAQELYSLMKDIKEILSKGGKQPMYNVYAVEIGGELWRNIYSYLVEKYPVEDAPFTSKYNVEGVYADGEEQKFFTICTEENKYLRFNFEFADGIFAVEEPIELGEDFQPQETAQFSTEAVNEFITNFIAENQGKSEQDNQPKIEKPMKEEKPAEESTEEPAAPAYSLDEIPEYQQALARITELENDYSAKEEEVNTLNSTIATLNEELASLREFKNTADRKEKQAMIDGFYMLSEEDKKDVVEHIDEYSLDDIESRLSIICVRNKVSFDREDNNTTKGSTTYSLEEPVDTTPAWIKAVLDTEKELNKI